MGESGARKGKAASSLERVLAVLEVFSEEHLEWTPEALMRELGYTRPTLYRYLRILKEAGFLMSMRGAGFTLGPKVVEMDYLMRKSDALMLATMPYIRQLTAEHACTALLVRWYGDKILCVASESSTQNPLSSYPRGRPMPLGRGAIARSIMAFLPRQRLLPLIERSLAELRSIGLGETVEAVQASLRKVRRDGFSVAYGEVTPGAVGIAAPILDSVRAPIASLCVTISGASLTGGEIDAIAKSVRQIAAQIGAEVA